MEWFRFSSWWKSTLLWIFSSNIKHNSKLINQNYLIIKKHLKEEKLSAAFKYFDNDDCGFITANSVIETLKNNDIPIDEQGLINFFERYYNINKKLTYKEFNHLFNNSA